MDPRIRVRSLPTSELLLAGADFVKGSRFVQGRRHSGHAADPTWGNKALTMLVRWLFGGRYTDLCYGYNAFWADVVPLLKLDADGFEIETLMNIRALRANLKVAEVASFERERLYGEAKLRALPDGWRVLKTILRERFADAFPAAADRPDNARTAGDARGSCRELPTARNPEVDG